MSYSITINGGAVQTLESLRLAFSALDLANMAPDFVSLKWSRRTASEACPLAHNDDVEIFLDSTRLFCGRARLGAVAADSVSIRIAGPWSHLEEQTYHLSLAPGRIGRPDGFVLGETYAVTYPPFSLSPGQTLSHTITFTISTRSRYTGFPATTGETDVNMVWASRCWLFRPGGTAGQIYTTQADELDRVLLFMSTTNAPDLFTVGDIDLGITLAPRVRTIVDQPVSECVKQVLAMNPSAAAWWEYEGSGLPVFRVGAASEETPLELVIGDHEGQALTDYQLKVADELVPAGVVVRWEQNPDDSTGLGDPQFADFFPGMEVLTNGSVTNTSTTVTCDSTANLEVGMTLVAIGVPQGAIVSSITNGTTFVISSAATGTLAGQRMIARKATGATSYQPGVLVHTVAEDVTVVPGIAKEIYHSLAVRRAQGTLTVYDPDFALGLRPGRVIYLTGDPQLTDVQLWVQSISWSPDTGLAQLTVGYPQHLQLRDRIDLKGWFRWSFTGPLGEVYSWITPAP